MFQNLWKRLKSSLPYMIFRQKMQDLILVSFTNFGTVSSVGHKHRRRASLSRLLAFPGAPGLGVRHWARPESGLGKDWRAARAWGVILGIASGGCTGSIGLGATRAHHGLSTACCARRWHLGHWTIECEQKPWTIETTLSHLRISSMLLKSHI
jgi:hypothetical protein